MRQYAVLYRKQNGSEFVGLPLARTVAEEIVRVAAGYRYTHADPKAVGVVTRSVSEWEPVS